MMQDSMISHRVPPSPGGQVKTAETAPRTSGPQAISGSLFASAARAPAAGSALRRRPPVDLEIVIPALNEEARIWATVAALSDRLANSRLECTLVVVDNGSIDATAEVGHMTDGRVPVRIIGCRQRGKGAAVRRGVMTSRARWIGFCDADLSTPPSTIDKVVTLLEEGSPIVVASRRCAGGQYLVPQPLIRRAGGWLFRALARDLTGPIADTQCGFKFFDGNVARQLFGSSGIDGFAFDLEILALARIRGIEVVELPVDWSDQSGSTLRLWDGLRALREVGRVRESLEQTRTREGDTR